MLLGLDGTALLASLISTFGVLGVGVLGYLGIKAQLIKATDSNTTQHGELTVAVRSLDTLVRDVDATIGLLVTTQGFPLFKHTSGGSLIWVNSAALELIGLPFDQLSDASVWSTVIHPDDRDRVVANWNRQLLEGKTSPAIVYRYTHPLTNRNTTVRAMSRPVYDTEGEIREWVSMVVPLHNDKEYEDVTHN